LAVAVAVVFKWKETKISALPTEEVEENLSTTKFRNPFELFSKMKNNRQIIRMAVVYALSSVSLSVFSSWYVVLDWTFKWGPLRIGEFATCVGIAIAIVQSIVIRVLVPGLLPQSRAVVVSLGILSTSLILYGLAFQGWQMYAILPLMALGSVVEPCLQAMMADSTPETLQGSLQGALYGLRILAQGISSPLYGLLFSLGTSHSFSKFPLPGLSFLFASVSSFLGCVLSFKIRCKGREKQNAEQLLEPLLMDCHDSQENHLCSEGNACTK